MTIIFYYKKCIDNGVHDFTWNNFSSDRRQYVCIKGCDSNKARLLNGVPQGSIIGPLLFLIYINDLLNVSKALSPDMFVDDTTLIITHGSFNTLMKEAKTGLYAYACRLG